jgi:hypothetical protein
MDAMVFTAGEDRKVVMWDPQTWEEIGDFGLSDFTFGGNEEWQGPFVHRRMVRANCTCILFICYCCCCCYRIKRLENQIGLFRGPLVAI